MRVLVIFFFVLLSFSTLFAAAYKGQREFTRYCVACHTSGQSFVAKKIGFDWEMMMENKGRALVAAHLESNDAKDALKYFHSPRYEKNYKHLKDFLLEYAKDSGNVPACN